MGIFVTLNPRARCTVRRLEVQLLVLHVEVLAQRAHVPTVPLVREHAEQQADHDELIPYVAVRVDACRQQAADAADDAAKAGGER